MTLRQKVRVYDGMPFDEVTLPDSIQDYHELWRTIVAMPDQGEKDAALRCWILASNYFLLRFVTSAGIYARNKEGELIFDHPSHLECANRLQFDPLVNDSVLIGARGWGKSSQLDADDIRAFLTDPNFTICYFSLTKLLASSHLRLILQELENNVVLRSVFPDRLWNGPEERRDTGVVIPWSITTGICIKRTSSRIELTIEAHAFENSLPAGMHFDRRRYDDIEAERAVESALTAETIHARWVSSQQLASSIDQRRVAGTYYAPDALMVRLTRDMGLQKIFYPGEDLSRPCSPATAGPLGGTPVNTFSREALWQKLKKAGGAEFYDGQWKLTSDMRARNDYSRQIACDPLAGEATRLDWRTIRFYDGEAARLPNIRQMVVVVCCDCSVGLGDPTCIWVWGLTEAREFWWLDGELKVLLPRERKALIHDVVRRWMDYGAKVEQCRIEQFGQAQYVQDQLEHWSSMPGFKAPLIIQCNDNRKPAAGFKVQNDLKTYTIWDRWQGATGSSKVVFPREMWRDDEKGNSIELVAYFKAWEFEMFPRCRTDNMLDAGKLIWEDPARVGPLPWPRKPEDPAAYVPQRRGVGVAAAGVS